MQVLKKHTLLLKYPVCDTQSHLLYKQTATLDKIFKVLYLEQVYDDSCEIDVTNYHDVEMSEEFQFP
jgi:hypothetical protein